MTAERAGDLTDVPKGCLPYHRCSFSLRISVGVKELTPLHPLHAHVPWFNYTSSGWMMASEP
jgi:hypothetical protein